MDIEDDLDYGKFHELPYEHLLCDLSKYKQGLFFSGNHLPIVSPEKLVEDKPDYVLILAWNFAKEIISQQEKYRTFRFPNFLVE